MTAEQYTMYLVSIIGHALFQFYSMGDNEAVEEFIAELYALKIENLVPISINDIDTDAYAKASSDDYAAAVASFQHQAGSYTALPMVINVLEMMGHEVA